MLFRRLIFLSVAIGLAVGALLGIGEQFTTAPLIAQAEHYEQPAHHHAAGAHSADEVHAWAPADGAPRMLFTIAADIGVAMGFALLLMVAMSVATLARGTPLGPAPGALWGLSGFAAVFVAPALGLSPEVPGTLAAALTDRQLWWAATVAVVIVALAMAVFAPGWKKLPALVLMPLPYLFGAPEPAGSAYAGHGPAATAALEQIHQQFIWASGATNLVLWLVLGTACGWAMRRRIGAAGSPQGMAHVAR
ncbi:CbtA family protein [Salinisphaera sp. RV14]|uniref:CbtA family protein n=1 Tax=Salinisphaera sp. RV14 TaxID=3454140 RepID=UPI003F85103E